MFIRHLLPAIGAIFLVMPCAHGGLTVTMSGTIGEGVLTINGNDTAIDGEAFTVIGELASAVDLDGRSDVGSFAMSQAEMLVAGLQFEFDSSNVFFGQFVRDPTAGDDYGFAITDSPTGNPNNFGYLNAGQPTPPFDPNVVSLIDFSTFSTGFHDGTGAGADDAIFSDASGQSTLRITGAPLVTGATVSVVPEPTFLGVLMLVGSVVVTRRRRASR